MGQGEKDGVLHEQMLRNTIEDVEELKKMTYVIPQRLDNLDQRVGELCLSIASLLQKLEEKYQTKEMCLSCSNSFKKDINSLEEKNALLVEDIKQLESFNEKSSEKIDALKTRIIILLLSVLGQLIYTLYKGGAI